MEITEAQVGQWVEEILDDQTIFLVETLIKGDKGGKKKIIIYLDGDKGLTIDQCSAVSRKLGSKLEEDPQLSAFTLEVSSYGVGKPLKLKRQYHNNLGRKVKLELANGKSEEGTLKEVQENSLTIVKKKKKETKELTFDFDEINNTQVLVSFK